MPIKELKDRETILPDGVKLIETTIHGDDRGDLISIEQGVDVPFEIRRVYTLFHTTFHVIRGCHAHMDMTQLIMNVTGSYQLTVDDGRTKAKIDFNKPGHGLLIYGPIWRELTHFSPGSVINCFANKHFNECNYVSDYEEFIALARSH